MRVSETAMEDKKARMIAAKIKGQEKKFSRLENLKGGKSSSDSEDDEEPRQQMPLVYMDVDLYQSPIDWIYNKSTKCTCGFASRMMNSRKHHVKKSQDGTIKCSHWQEVQALRGPQEDGGGDEEHEENATDEEEEGSPASLGSGSQNASKKRKAEQQEEEQEEE